MERLRSRLGRPRSATRATDVVRHVRHAQLLCQEVKNFVLKVVCAALRVMRAAGRQLNIFCGRKEIAAWMAGIVDGA